MPNLEISSIQGKTLDPKNFRRDTRSLGKKIFDWYLSQNHLVLVVGFLAFSSVGLFFVASWAIWFLFGFSLLSFFIGRSHYERRHLPIRLPAVAGITDYGDPAPGHFKYNKSKGIFFLGNSKSAEAEDGWGVGEEFWVADTDMRRHFLVFGSTGSGKTVTLVGMSFNALAMGSGLIYVDPKADAKLVTQIYRLARFLGREEDVRVLNFMTGNRDQAMGTKRSNTVNPFAFGDATSLSDILASMIPASEGDNAIFSQRAISLIKAIMPPLVEMRDRNERLLSVETIREFLTFDAFIKLGARAHKGEFSDKVKSTMAAYLGSLGLKPDGEATSQKQGKPDNSKAVEQFQYATMYFTRAMDSLATDYGYIYNVLRGEVDYRDVFFNRRILVVLLPALEKNESEIALLGKLVLFAIKNALASGLGSRIEGTADETLGSRPSSSNRPMLLVLDEYAALQVKGFAEAATQGRSLGASCVFANQDLAGFMKASEAEAEQILANTRCQIFMYQGDLNKTMDYIVKKAGKAATMRTQGYASSPSSMTGTYKDKQEATLDISERAVAADFLKLTEGEFFLVFDDKFVVGQAFFDPLMDPKGGDMMRVNRLLMISPPEHTHISVLAMEGESLLSSLSEVIRGTKPLPTDSGQKSAMIEALVRSNSLVTTLSGSAQELGIATFMKTLGWAGEGEDKSSGSASSGKSGSGPKTASAPAPPPVVPSPPAVPDAPPSPAREATPPSVPASARTVVLDLDDMIPDPLDDSPAGTSDTAYVSPDYMNKIDEEEAPTFGETESVPPPEPLDVFPSEWPEKEGAGELTYSKQPDTVIGNDRLREIGVKGEGYQKAVEIESFLSGKQKMEAQKTLDDWIDRSLSVIKYPPDDKKEMFEEEKKKGSGRWENLSPQKAGKTETQNSQGQDIDDFLSKM